MFIFFILAKFHTQKKCWVRLVLQSTIDYTHPSGFTLKCQKGIFGFIQHLVSLCGIIIIQFWTFGYSKSPRFQ
jgi:hypothetical protein